MYAYDKNKEKVHGTFSIDERLIIVCMGFLVDFTLEWCNSYVSKKNYLFYTLALFNLV